MKRMELARVKEGQHKGELVPVLQIEPHNVRRKPLWWQEEGLSFTASGYSRQLPTEYMARVFDNRWRRVYCVCLPNNFILHLNSCHVQYKGKLYFVDFEAPIR